MKILIITGGRIDEDFALNFLKEAYFEHIIVVDGALAFVEKVENTIGKIQNFDYLVGDFDTISPEILEKYLNRGNLTVRRFNPEKDNTDTDIALKLAVELCQSVEGAVRPEIVFLGATGTRADHMLANLQLLEQAHGAGVEAVIADQYNRIRLVEDACTIQKDEQFGHYVSLIPITETLEAVTLKGFKYPLSRHTVYRGDSLCVSNELIEAVGNISIEKGRAYLIESRD